MHKAGDESKTKEEPGKQMKEEMLNLFTNPKASRRQEGTKIQLAASEREYLKQAGKSGPVASKFIQDMEIIEINLARNWHTEWPKIRKEMQEGYLKDCGIIIITETGLKKGKEPYTQIPANYHIPHST